jgi:hypothetical protein
MPEIKEWITQVERVSPPDLWADIHTLVPSLDRPEEPPIGAPPRRRPSSAPRKKVAVIVCALALTAVATGALIRAFRTDRSVVPSQLSPSAAWGCPAENRGVSIGDYAPTGGERTALAAATGSIPMLRQDGTGSQQELETAFHSTEGPTRYDSGTGLLFIDGTIQARLGIAELTDGTFVAGSIEHCMRPPSKNDSPGPTPSPGQQGSSEGALTCQAANQRVRFPYPQTPFADQAPSAVETVRRNVRGLLATDRLYVALVDEAGTFVAVRRGSEIVARIRVDGASTGSAWSAGEVAICAGSGIHVPT